MSTESELKRYRDQAVRLRGDISRYSSTVATKRKKTADAQARASRSKSSTTIRSRLRKTKLDRVLAQDHYWYEYRNAGGPAIASAGYGLVAAALAEATDGVIASFDSAFDIEHNGETAEQFLTWWGDRQINFYGAERFLAARTVK